MEDKEVKLEEGEAYHTLGGSVEGRVEGERSGEESTDTL
jgi:hypothetical protein